MAVKKIIRRGAKNSRVLMDDGTIKLIPTSELPLESYCSSRRDRMVPSHYTLEDIPSLYSYFNQHFFNNELPSEMPIATIRATSFVGRFVVRSFRTHIELSEALLEKDKTSVEDVLLHEMIHAWQYHVDHSRLDHGARFKFKMNQINTLGDRHISTRYNSVDYSSESEFYIIHSKTSRRESLSFSVDKPVSCSASCKVYKLPIETRPLCRGFKSTMKAVRNYGVEV